MLHKDPIEYIKKLCNRIHKELYFFNTYLVISTGICVGGHKSLCVVCVETVLSKTYTLYCILRVPRSRDEFSRENYIVLFYEHKELQE